MEHSGRWLLFEQHLFVPKHVTLSQKMRLALLVSIPASCFFDQQAVHDKNSKGDIRGFLPHAKSDTLAIPFLKPYVTEALFRPKGFPQVFVCAVMSTASRPHVACIRQEPTTWTDNMNQHFSTFIFQSKVWIVTTRTIGGGVANIASQEKVEEPWVFECEVPACWNRISWGQGAAHRKREGEAARCLREGLIGKQVESCTLANHVTRLAQRVNIPLALLTSSEVLPCAHRADMSLDMLKKSQLVRASGARLLEQNFLRAGCRTQIEGSCRVYVEKPDWKASWKLYTVPLQARSEGLWWSTLADDSFSSSICLFQSMWHYRRRCL